MDWRVPLADLDYGQGEEEAVLKVIRSKWLTMGDVTQEFEAKFASRIGAKYAFAVSNATEALHLACLVLGIGPEDEVITPSLSFVATSNAVLYTGAEVRFADVIGPAELTIDPDEIVRWITPRTRAIIVMHYAGYPCRMEEIMEISDQYGLPVIEDAAHAPGASLGNKAIGTWGALGCFSFFSNKNLSTGEGGMITTNRDDCAEKIRLCRSHGMTTLTYDRHKGHAYSYDVVDLGYNYRIDEIRSALGLVQLEKLDVNNALRRKWTERYWQKLSGLGVELPFIKLQQSRTDCIPSYHIFPMLLPQGVNRKAFIDRLREERIQTSIHYPPTHCFTYYRGRYGENSLPRTEEIAEREVTLPLYPGMGEGQVDLVVDAVMRALEAA
jgi:dTDP-4-amino-4,6-dideoxygalactose transaminase